MFIKPVSAENNSGINELFESIVKEALNNQEKISNSSIFEPLNEYWNY